MMPNVAGWVKAQLAFKVSLSYVDTILAAKHPLLLPKSELYTNKLLFENSEPPTSTPDMHLITDAITVGLPTWLSATSALVNVYSSAQAASSITIGISGQATIAKNGDITTQGNIASTSDLTPTQKHIYTTKQVNNLLSQYSIRCY